jgi:hypothetical protein
LFLDQQIGATEVIGRDAITTGRKAFDGAPLAGAIDAVGGAPLDAILRSITKRRVGMNGDYPVAVRGSAWQRAPGPDFRSRHFDKIWHHIAFADLRKYGNDVIAGGIRGRAVVTIRS